jgi:VWFA-related protein
MLAMLGRSFVALGPAGILLAGALMAPQHLPQFSPGEVRISSRPYSPRAATLHSEARLVVVEIVVRDSRGKPVKGLTKDDFELTDAGKKRESAAFAVETTASDQSSSAEASDATSAHAAASGSAPGPIPAQAASAGRSLALFFDDINTPPSDLARAKIAATRFLKEELAPGDRVAIFSASTGEALGFRADTNSLISAVHQLQSHPRASSSGSGSCPRITPYQAYQISSGDPGALQAAVMENCKCPGHDGSECMDIQSMPAYQLDSSMAGGGAVGPGGGSQDAGNIIAEVKTQASATWLQAKLISETTFDAVRSSVRSLATMPGKRMLLIASSGFITGELEQEEDAIVQDALRGGVVINSLDAKGVYAESTGRPLNEASDASETHPLSMVYEARALGERLESQDAPLARLAESTGGLFFHNNNDLNLGFYQLGVIPDVAYQLAFPPAEDGKYHKLKVELRNKSAGFVQARPGYFAPNRARLAQPDPAETLDRAVEGDDDSNAMDAGVTLQLAKTGENGRRLTLNIYVDSKKLPFRREKDLELEKLTFVAALYDLEGTLIAGREAEMNLALKPDSFARLADSGITGTLSLDAPPGFYRLRSVVQEGVEGKIMAQTKKLHID